MKLQINKKIKIKEIQNKFSEAYPYLKIEFYKNATCRKRIIISGG